MRRVLVALTVFVALALALALASAATAANGGFFAVIFGGGPASRLPLSESTRDIGARVNGELVVRFHGDPGVGCAVRGLCQYSGTIIWTPAHSADLEVDALTDRRGTGYSLDLEIDQGSYDTNGGGTTDEDTRAGGVECADAASTGSDFSFPVSHGRARIELADAEPSLFGTRCAGPLAGDLASALPTASAVLSRLMRGETSFSLSGDHTFASHGFAGTVASTLSVSLRRPGRWQRVRFKLSSQRRREVMISYRATLAGELVAAVNGDADEGLCGPLGACAARGTVSMQPAPGGQASFIASGSTRRPYATLLRALRSGVAPKGVSMYGFMSWRGGGRINANLRGPGGVCSDSTGLAGSYAEVNLRPATITAQFSIGDYPDGDLRTRCPGPLAPQEALATGHAPESIVGRPTSTFLLTPGRPFIDDGYTGSLSSTLRVTLWHEQVKRQTVSEVSASG
jgi:hypothetical protein